MDGTNVSRSLNALKHMVLHPHHASRWMRDRVLRRSPLDMAVPWTSFPCIEYLDSHVSAGMKVLEYGGGGSTRFFLRKGCSVTTVEDHEGWVSEIQEYAKRDGTDSNLELRYIPVEDAESVKKYVDALHEGGPWDVVFIDGREDEVISRTQCLDAVSQLSNENDWLIVLDDAWRSQYQRHALNPETYRHVQLVGLGPARIGVTRSDLFFKPGGRFDQ